ncbi:MAG: DNA cytosine methyltransferase [Roseovarius confluentis]
MYRDGADLEGVGGPSRPAPTFIDAFAGCGGLSLGLKRAGWRGLFAIEKAAFAFETLNTNFPPNAERLGYDWPETIERQAWDIRQLIDMRVEALHGLAGRVDLIAGGPPCQGFSHAGRRRADDPRNRLFEAYLELVAIVRPRLVLIENVRGFTSDFQRKDGEIENFAETLQARLGTTYSTTNRMLKASDLGVPQARPRFFLIGIRKDLGDSERLGGFFDRLVRDSGAFLQAHGLDKVATARDAISDLEVGFAGKLACVECKGFEAIGYKGPRTRFQEAMRDGHAGAPSDTRLARHRPDIAVRFASIIAACREEGRLNVTISAETRKAHGLKKMAIRVLDPLAPAPTITSLPDDLLHYSEPRTLSVRENARLQTFPDWFQFKGKYTTGGTLRAREVPRFTQVANAVPPLLAEQLGLGLLRLIGASVDMPIECIANGDERRLMLVQHSAE